MFTPLLDTLSENARWIWAPDVAGANAYAEFCCAVNVSANGITEAWIQLSAETSLRLWVNGRLLHAGPPREVPPYFYFDTIDLRPHLVTGHNEVRIIAHHQGKHSQSYQAGTPAILVGGRCAVGEVTTADFADVGEWQARRVTRYRQDAHRLFGCIGFSEHVDFAAVEAEWECACEVAVHPWAERPQALPRDLPEWRERAQYLDCQHYMGAMLRLFGTLEPIRRFLHQFPSGADATGLLRACYPSPAGMTVIPDFSMSYAVLLQRYLELSGDLETVRKNLPLAERGVLAYRQYEDNTGLLTDVPGWIFLDNTFELPKFPRSAGLNAVYHGGYRSLAALMRECGDESRATEFDGMAARIRAAFRTVFLRNGSLLDSDSTPEHEAYRQWVYHYSAETGRWKGKSFRLRVSFRLTDPAHPLRLAVHGGGRAWIDGLLVADIKEGGSWTRSGIYEATEISTPADNRWHQLDLEVEWSGIDWECYISSKSDVTWSAAQVWDEEAHGVCQSAARPTATVFSTA